MGDKHQMKIRLDNFGNGSLRRLIEAEAERDDVSMNSVIVARLQASYALDLGLSNFGHDLLVLALRTELESRAKSRKQEDANT